MTEVDPTDAELRQNERIATLERLVRRLVRAWFMTLLSVMLTIGGGIWYINYVDRESNQLWCGLVPALDDRYRKLTPTDADQADLFRRIAELRRGLDCP